MRFTVRNAFRSFDIDDMEQEDIVGADPEIFYGSINNVGLQEAATIECLSFLNNKQGLGNIDEITIGSISTREATVSGIKDEADAKELMADIEDARTSFIESVDIEKSTTGDRWRLLLTPKTGV